MGIITHTCTHAGAVDVLCHQRFVSQLSASCSQVEVEVEELARRLEQGQEQVSRWPGCVGAIIEFIDWWESVMYGSWLAPLAARGSKG